MIPSRTTLRRAQLRLDTAFMLTQKQATVSAGPVIRFSWADSSPQVGRDWLIIKERIPLDALIHTTCACNELVRAGAALTRDERSGFNMVLAQNVRERVLPPVAMGSGKTGIEHKVAAMLHALALESADSRTLDGALNSIVSFTTDLGTEAKISDFTVLAKEELMPPWMASGMLQPDGLDAEVEPVEGPTFLMPNAVVVPGSLHLLHSVARGMAASLQGWEAFFNELKVLEALLVSRHRRERFLATCVQGTRHEARLGDFHSFSATLYESRWNDVINFIRAVHDLVPMVKAAWSQRAYESAGERAARAPAAGDDGGGEGGGAADDPRRGFDAAQLTQVLQGPLFFANMKMVLCLQSVTKDLAAWMEGCPCHEHLLVGTTAHFQRKALSAEFRAVRDTCPLAGCRAPELAAGRLEQQFARINALALAELMAAVAHDLTAEQWGHVSANFERGRAHLQLGLEVKFAFWKEFPWRLAGICLWDCTFCCCKRHC